MDNGRTGKSVTLRDIAREMGCTGNQIASSLRSGRTLILGGMSNPFYGIMADAIRDAAQATGNFLIILCSRDDAELEARLVAQALARQVDGRLACISSEDRAIIISIASILNRRPAPSWTRCICNAGAAVRERDTGERTTCTL